MRRFWNTGLCLLFLFLIGGLSFAEDDPDRATAEGTITPAEPGKKKPDEKDVKKVEDPTDAPKQAPGSKLPANLGSGLKKIAPTTWEVTQEEVVRLLIHAPLLSRQLWVRQVKKKGKLVGYKLKNIKKKSIVYRAGFRNGDVVTMINGKPLKTPEQFLLEIPGSKMAVVKLYRKGKLRTQTYLFVQ